MKITDKIRIEASREQVFAALNDPEILRQAIPGCQELDQTSETELTATVQAKVGPVKAKFRGVVTLSDINPPESYIISGEGKGGEVNHDGDQYRQVAAGGVAVQGNWLAGALAGHKVKCRPEASARRGAPGA